MASVVHHSQTPEGVLADNAVGMYGTDEVYSDLDVEKFERLPRNQPHRGVDLEVLEADKQGKGKPLAYIIAIECVTRLCEDVLGLPRHHIWNR